MLFDHILTVKSQVHMLYLTRHGLSGIALVAFLDTNDFEDHVGVSLHSKHSEGSSLDLFSFLL